MNINNNVNDRVCLFVAATWMALPDLQKHALALLRALMQRCGRNFLPASVRIGTVLVDALRATSFDSYVDFFCVC